MIYCKKFPVAGDRLEIIPKENLPTKKNPISSFFFQPKKCQNFLFFPIQKNPIFYFFFQPKKFQELWNNLEVRNCKKCPLVIKGIKYSFYVFIGKLWMCCSFRKFYCFHILNPKLFNHFVYQFFSFFCHFYYLFLLFDSIIITD